MWSEPEKMFMLVHDFSIANELIEFIFKQSAKSVPGSRARRPKSAHKKGENVDGVAYLQGELELVPLNLAQTVGMEIG